MIARLKDLQPSDPCFLTRDPVAYLQARAQEHFLARGAGMAVARARALVSELDEKLGRMAPQPAQLARPHEEPERALRVRHSLSPWPDDLPPAA